MNYLKKGLVCAALSIGMISQAALQTAVAENYLIKNATVHTASVLGSVKKTDVLVRDGKIVQVSQNISPTKDVVIINAKGKHVTPGLMNASTNLGLVEISAVSSTVDSSTKLDNVGASFNVAPAINFRSTLIPQNRIHGLTRAIVMPGFGESIFAGQASAIILERSLDGLINNNVAQIAAYGERGASKAGGSRASAMALLDQVLTDAAYLRRNENLYLPGSKSNFSQSIADLKALYPVLDRKTPLVIGANRSDDILRLITLAKKHRIKLVISGGGEAWMVAKQLAAAKIPVIIDPMQNLPSFESLSIRIDAATILAKAGVKLLFTGGGSHNGYLVRQSAGNAVAYGLPATVALEAMTINIAEVFGIQNYGQIAAGMDADLVIWDGDPLEITSNPDAVFIQGKNIPLVSRATRLRDRYWDLKGNHQQAYEH